MSLPFELSMEVTLQQISLFFAEPCRAECGMQSDDTKEGIVPFLAMAGSVMSAYFAIKAIITKLVMKCSLISC